MKVFFIHVRYVGAFIITFFGAVLSLPGEALIKLGQWIGSRSQ